MSARPRIAWLAALLAAAACSGPRTDEPPPGVPVPSLVPPATIAPVATSVAPPTTTIAPEPLPSGPPTPCPDHELTVFEGRSPFSHFLVCDRGPARSLYFIRDSGEIVLESSIDRATPDNLLVEYTRVMFASYLFRPDQKSALIVGLGGGAMVHFLNRFAPELRLDVVEIDPAIVKAAADLFGVHSTATTKILTEDAFAYLGASSERYDVIYMDAFLKPSPDTDDTGVPLRLKTTQFLRGLRKNLTDGGILVFNLNDHDETAEDMKSIRAAFDQTYVFDANGNWVVVGATTPSRVPPSALDRTAGELDARRRSSFSFRSLAKRLTAGP